MHIRSRVEGIGIDHAKRDGNLLGDALREINPNEDLKLKGRAFSCPFHEDKDPSGGMFQGKDGFWRWKCQSCSEGGTIVEALVHAWKMTDTEVCRILSNGKLHTPQAKEETPPEVLPKYADIKAVEAFVGTFGKVECTHYYYYEDKSLHFIVVRYLPRSGGEKKFMVARPEDGGFVLKAPDGLYSLYNLPNIKGADVVWVVEGEKCTKILYGYGIPATTSAFGKKSASRSDWGPLKGKVCYLWPDVGGECYTDDVARILHPIAKEIRIIDPASLGLADKEDVEQFIERVQGDIKAALQKVADGANICKRPMCQAMQESTAFVKGVQSGEICCLQWPFQKLHESTEGLIPSEVTILTGNPGARKSLLLLQALRYWHEQGVRIAILETEGTLDIHLRRTIRQKQGYEYITSVDGIRDNPDAVAALEEEERTGNGFGSILHPIDESKKFNLPYILAWIKMKAEEGYRLVCVDHISDVAKGDKSWTEDSEFIRSVHNELKKHNCSAIIVLHPIKRPLEPRLSELSGGAAFTRGAKTILWIRKHSIATSTVDKVGMGYPVQTDHDGTLHILKASYSYGEGLRLAMVFNRQHLTYEEAGFIVNKQDKG